MKSATFHNTAEVLRAWIKANVPADQLAPDFDARMDEWAAYCDEPVDAKTEQHGRTLLVQHGEPDRLVGIEEVL